jgi:hypothetical protein
LNRRKEGIKMKEKTVASTIHFTFNFLLSFRSLTSRFGVSSTSSSAVRRDDPRLRRREDAAVARGSGSAAHLAITIDDSSGDEGQGSRGGPRDDVQIVSVKNKEDEYAKKMEGERSVAGSPLRHLAQYRSG